MNILEKIVASGARLRPKTKDSYRRCVRDWLVFAGDAPAGWTPLQVDAFYAALCKTQRVASANAAIAGLRYASKRWATIHGGTDFAAHLETRRDEGPDEPETPLSAADLRRLLATCAGAAPADLRDRAMITLMVTTGMRRAGVAGVQFADFKSAKNLDYPVCEITLKGGARYPVPLLDQAITAITPWQIWLGARGQRSGPFWRSISLPRMTGAIAVGESLSYDGVCRVLQRRADQAKLTDFHPHVLRHTFITWCRLAAVPPNLIAAVTGHAEGGLIDRVYVNKEALGKQAREVIAPVFQEVL